MKTKPIMAIMMVMMVPKKIPVRAITPPHPIHILPRTKPMEEDPMLTEVDAGTFRNKLGEMIDHVRYRHDSIVLNRDGKFVAALIDTELFNRVRRMQVRLNGLAAAVAEAYAEIPAEEGIARIKALTASLRQPGSEG